MISIHAPAKGATILPACSMQRSRYFNPRSREGSDLLEYMEDYQARNFNPRSREGSDSKNHQDYSQ